MTKSRIEAFSDGVIATIITLMVLELRVPNGRDWGDLVSIAPVFLSHVLSFLNIGIYWNNHHHMFQSVRQISNWVMWANLHWLFWLALVPFTSGLIGEDLTASMPMALYAFDLLMCSVAYSLLIMALAAAHGSDSHFAQVWKSDRKGKLSLAASLASLLLSFVAPWASMLVILGVTLAWIVPDRRFARPDGSPQ